MNEKGSKKLEEPGCRKGEDLGDPGQQLHGAGGRMWALPAPGAGEQVRRALSGPRVLKFLRRLRSRAWA